MKKLLFILSSLVVLFMFQSCERKDIQDDIDDLNGRLDNLQSLVLQLNKDIVVYRDLVNGSLWIESYTVAANGDYTMKFTNGKKITVYSGNAEGELPVPYIRDGKWWYTVNDEEKPMMSGDQQASAAPADGKTPKMRIYGGDWQYSFDGETWIEVGNALPRNTVSIFETVAPVFGEDGTTVTGLEFTWMVGPDKISKTVLLSSGFSLEVKNVNDTPTAPLSIPCGTTKVYKVVQTNVSAAIIETNTWGVELTNAEIAITAPTTFGADVIRIKIFSPLNECKLVEIPVVTE